MKSLLPNEISSQQLQNLMQTAIAPRPIAFVSSIDQQGNVNLSPFSFFNMFSTQPPIIIFSPSRRLRDNTTKHSLQNVLDTREVAIGIVNFPIVQQASLTSTEYKKGVNEFIKAGLKMKPADLISPPLIEESPVNFECKVNDIISLGNKGGAGNLVICEVIKIHIREEYLDDKGNLDQKKLDLVARLGSNWYARNTGDNLFEVPKPLIKKGIGFDQLPDSIKYSSVFTGNDLGMLSNIEHLPQGHFSTQKKKHQKAHELLLENKIEEAWKVLTLD
ncbi:flavin reductase family protein [Elizabethkingia argentiflava]|uniref:Flavin reductase family protein n=1 Tax=Elizabethkingia argenteiflava TaxID=2681556 RepID=A0A845PWX6_9FLAO|nr:flavin reductase family protein [Elizabethkingia argenteiflava]NAW50957.1 flavin reductase family protein [Elizabethkingia argenteiflava]